MGKVLSAHAVSVDGYITGRDPGAGRGLADGTVLFDWYFDGGTPSRVFDRFRLSEPSARVFDAFAARERPPAVRGGAVQVGEDDQAAGVRPDNN